MYKAVRRAISATSILSLVTFGAIAQAWAADSYPPGGASALGTAQPQFGGYRVADIRDWSPETDPFAPYLRATVPLQKRIAHDAKTQANPTLDGKAQIMLMQGDYGNTFFGGAPANNDVTDNTLNFWQYVDYWSPWHGAATMSTPESIYDPATSDWRNRGFEFGIVNIPNPAYTNAAHRNGVKSIGTIYFDPNFRPGLSFREVFEPRNAGKDTPGQVVADKLIEMARYYGFDGYFLNQEEPGNDSDFKPFMAYLHRNGLWTQFYDTNSCVNDSKVEWLKDAKHGVMHDSVFVNYGWSGCIDSSLKYAKEHGIDPYTQTFFGVESNQGKFSGSHESMADLPNLYAPGTKNPRVALALFTPSDYYQRGLDDDIKIPDLQKVRPLMQTPGFQWMIHERERMYFSGMHEDVTHTGKVPGFSRPEVGVKDGSGWVGVADFTPARSTISGAKFASDFNTGHGWGHWLSGKPAGTEQWANINEQSLLPSWQWWFSEPSKMHASFDYGPAEKRLDTAGKPIEKPFTAVGAYNGGSSLAIYGEPTGDVQMRLFKTDLDVTAKSTATLTYRDVKGDSKIQLAAVFSNDPTKFVPLEGTATTENEWKNVTVDLAAHKGQKILTLGVILHGNGQALQTNVGQITVSDNRTPEATPADFHLDALYSDGQVRLSWKEGTFTNVDYYDVQVKTPKGLVDLGRTFDSRFYAKNLDMSGTLEFELRAIAKDGTPSAPATITVDTSKMARDLKAETTTAKAQFTQDATEGVSKITWKEVPGATAYRIVSTLVSTGCAHPSGEVTIEAPLVIKNGVGTYEMPTGVKEGEAYDISVTPLFKGVDSPADATGTPMYWRGRTHDSWAHPLMTGDAYVKGNQLYLSQPSPSDWKTITVKAGNDVVFQAERGTGGMGTPATNKQLMDPKDLSKYFPQKNGDLTLTLTDYNGNTSEPVTIHVKDGEGQLTVPAPADGLRCPVERAPKVIRVFSPLVPSTMIVVETLSAHEVFVGDSVTSTVIGLDPQHKYDIVLHSKDVVLGKDLAPNDKGEIVLPFKAPDLVGKHTVDVYLAGDHTKALATADLTIKAHASTPTTPATPEPTKPVKPEPTKPGEPAKPAPTTPGEPGHLSNTGSNGGIVAGAGFLMLLAGAGLVMVSRRKQC